MATRPDKTTAVEPKDSIPLPDSNSNVGVQSTVTFSGSLAAPSAPGRERRRGWRLPSAANMTKRRSSFKAGQPGVQSNLPITLEVLPSASSLGVQMDISATLRFLVRDIQCLAANKPIGLRLAAANHARSALAKYSHQQAALSLLWSAVRPLLWESNVSARQAAFDVACDMCSHHFFALGALRAEFLYMVVLAHRGDEQQRQRLLRRATQDGASMDPYTDAVAAAMAGFSDMDSDHKAFCTMITRTCHKGARCLPPKVISMIARRLCYITRRALRRETALCRKAIEAFEALLSSKALQPTVLPRVVDALTRLVNVECKATWEVFRRLLADTHSAPIVLQLLLDTLQGENPVSKSTPVVSDESHRPPIHDRKLPDLRDAGSGAPVIPPAALSPVAGVSSSALRGAVYLLSMARYSYSAQPSAQQIPLLTVAAALQRASESDATAVLQEVLLSLARMVKQFGPHLINEWHHLAAVLHKAARWCHQRRKLQHATMQAMQAASHLARAGTAGRAARPAAATGGVTAPAAAPPRSANLPAGMSAEPVTVALRGFAQSIVGLYLAGQYHGSEAVASSMWEALPDIMPEHSQMLQLQSAVARIAHTALQAGAQHQPSQGSHTPPWWHTIPMIVRLFYIEQSFPAVRACAIHGLWLLWRATRHLHDRLVSVPAAEDSQPVPLAEVFIQHGFKPLLVSCFVEVDPSIRMLLMAVAVNVASSGRRRSEHSPLDLQLAVLCNSQHMAVVKTAETEAVPAWSRAWHTRAILPESEIRVGFLDAVSILALVQVSHTDASTSVVASEREQALQALQLLSDAIESANGQHVVRLQSQALQSAVERLPLDIVAAARSSVAQLSTAGLLQRLLVGLRSGNAETVHLVVGVLQGLAAHHSFPGTRFHALCALLRVCPSACSETVTELAVPFLPPAAAHVAATASAAAVIREHKVRKDVADCLVELDMAVSDHTLAICLAGLRLARQQVAARERNEQAVPSSAPPSKSLSDFLSPPSIVSPSSAEFLLALQTVCARALSSRDESHRLAVTLEFLQHTVDLTSAILACSDPWAPILFGAPPVSGGFTPIDLLSTLLRFLSSAALGVQHVPEYQQLAQVLNVLCVDCIDVLREACACVVPVSDVELRPASKVCASVQDLASAVAALGTTLVQAPKGKTTHPAVLLQAMLLCASCALGCLKDTAAVSHQQVLCILSACNCAGSVAYGMLLTGVTQDDSVIALAQQISVVCLTVVCKLAAGAHWQVEDPPVVSDRRAGFRPNKMPQAKQMENPLNEKPTLQHRLYLHGLQVAYRTFVEAYLAGSRHRRRVLHQQLNPLLLSISRSLRACLAETLSRHADAPDAVPAERCLGILSSCHSLLQVMQQYHSHKLGFVELNENGSATLHTFLPGEDSFWSTRSRRGFHVRVMYGAPLELNTTEHPRTFPRSQAKPSKHDLLNSTRLIKSMSWETQNSPDVDTAAALLACLFTLPRADPQPEQAVVPQNDADTEWAFVHRGRLYSVRVGCNLQISIRCRQSTVCEEWHGSLLELLQAAPVDDTQTDEADVTEEGDLTVQEMYTAPSPDRVERSSSLATITATSFSQSAVERPRLLQAAEHDISVLHFAVRDEDIMPTDAGHWDAASSSSSDDSAVQDSFGYFVEREGTGLNEYPVSAQLQLLQTDAEVTGRRASDDAVQSSEVVRVGRGHSVASDEVHIALGHSHDSRSSDNLHMALSISPVSAKAPNAADSEGEVSPEVQQALSAVNSAFSPQRTTVTRVPTDSTGSPEKAAGRTNSRSVSPDERPMRVMVHPLKVQDLTNSKNPESDSVMVFGVGASAAAHSPRRRHTAWEKGSSSQGKKRTPVSRTMSTGKRTNDLDGVALQRSISARESLNAVRQRLKRTESVDIFAAAPPSAQNSEETIGGSTAEAEHFVSPHQLQNSLVGDSGGQAAPSSPVVFGIPSPGVGPAESTAGSAGGSPATQKLRSDTEGSLTSLGSYSHTSPVLGALSARAVGLTELAAASGSGITTGIATRKWSMVSAASTTSDKHETGRSRKGSEDLFQQAAQARRTAAASRVEQLLSWTKQRAETCKSLTKEKTASIQAAFEADVGDVSPFWIDVPHFEDPESLAAISSASLIWAYLSWGAALPDAVPSPEHVARTLQRKSIYPIKCEQRVLQRSLAVLDRTLAVDTCKVGVVYVASGQSQEHDILLNQSMDTSEAFNAFVGQLGWRVRTEGCPAWLFLGGVSRTGCTDGEVSLVWHSRSGALQTAFHVAPWIRSANISVNCEDEEEVFVRVKRHIGNDFVTVAFVEPGGEANLSTFTGHFSNVLILVQPQPGGAVDAPAPSGAAAAGSVPSAYLVTVLSKQALSTTCPLDSSNGFMSSAMELQTQGVLGMAALGSIGLQRALSTVCVDGCPGHSVVPAAQPSAPGSAASDLNGVHADPRSLFTRVDGLRGDAGKPRSGQQQPHSRKGQGQEHVHVHSSCCLDSMQDAQPAAQGNGGRVCTLAAGGRLVQCSQATVRAAYVGEFVRQLAVQCDIAVRASVPTALHASPLSGPAARFEQYQRILTRLMGTS